MISKGRCFKLVLSLIPEIEPYWVEYQAYWGDEEPGLCNDMAMFGRYTWKQIEQAKYEILPRIFGLAERLLVEGDQEVRDAVATCFLENLLNRVSGDRAALSLFLGLLGPKSRDYCAAWDEFTGVRKDT